MATTLERRAVCELRTSGRRLEGYAATFGTEARIGDTVETIRVGAFAKSLASKRDVLALVDHDPGRLVGRTSSGTLKLTEDTRGLEFRIDVPGTQTGRDLLELAQRGDLGGMSIGFVCSDDQWSGKRRELRAVDLYEVSVVSSWPAYPETSVVMRAGSMLTLARRWLATT